jgi:hypothetical protein
VRVDFGQTKFPNKKTNQRAPVVLDLDRTINGHILIAGASGTGKTHQIRRILREMSAQDPEVRFHVLDVHGDIDVQGASTCRFSETSNYGVNPLKVDADRDMGGVRKRTRAFMSSLTRTANKLGSKQEAALYNLMIDLYEDHGFLVDRPETWALDVDPRAAPRAAKRQPTLEDLRVFAEGRLQQMATGAGALAVAKLDELNRKVRSLQRKQDKADDSDALAVQKLRAECIDLYREYVEAVETGREMATYVRYSGRDVLQSVYERIRNLESSGVFRPRRPDFDRSCPVWRYEISSLSREEQVLFVEFVAQELFQAARRQGHVGRPRHWIVLDEAHAFVNDDADHILNVIIKEARKYGLGLILASQSLGHFPDDILANSASKVLLGIDEMFHQTTARKLAIEQKRLGFIVPRRTALVQFKRGGDTSNRYIDVDLP